MDTAQKKSGFQVQTPHHCEYKNCVNLATIQNPSDGKWYCSMHDAELRRIIQGNLKLPILQPRTMVSQSVPIGRPSDALSVSQFLPRPPVQMSPVPEELSLCLVCEENKIPKSQVLKCGHAICDECLPQLRLLNCPFCRAPLEGPLVTLAVQRSIRINMDADKQKEDERANLLARINGYGGRMSDFYGNDLDELRAEIRKLEREHPHMPRFTASPPIGQERTLEFEDLLLGLTRALAEQFGPGNLVVVTPQEGHEELGGFHEEPMIPFNVQDYLVNPVEPEIEAIIRRVAEENKDLPRDIVEQIIASEVETYKQRKAALQADFMPGSIPLPAPGVSLEHPIIPTATRSMTPKVQALPNPATSSKLGGLPPTANIPTVQSKVPSGRGIPLLSIGPPTTSTSVPLGGLPIPPSQLPGTQSSLLRLPLPNLTILSPSTNAYGGTFLPGRLPTPGRLPLSTGTFLPGRLPLPGEPPLPSGLSTPGRLSLPGEPPLPGGLPTPGRLPLLTGIPLLGGLPTPGRLPLSTELPLLSELPIQGGLPISRMLSTSSKLLLPAEESELEPTSPPPESLYSLTLLPKAPINLQSFSIPVISTPKRTQEKTQSKVSSTIEPVNITYPPLIKRVQSVTLPLLPGVVSLATPNATLISAVPGSPVKQPSASRPSPPQTPIYAAITTPIRPIIPVVPGSPVKQPLESRLSALQTTSPEISTSPRQSSPFISPEISPESSIPTFSKKHSHSHSSSAKSSRLNVTSPVVPTLNPFELTRSMPGDLSTLLQSGSPKPLSPKPLSPEPLSPLRVSSLPEQKSLPTAASITAQLPIPKIRETSSLSPPMSPLKSPNMSGIPIMSPRRSKKSSIPEPIIPKILPPKPPTPSPNSPLRTISGSTAELPKM